MWRRAVVLIGMVAVAAGVVRAESVGGFPLTAGRLQSVLTNGATASYHIPSVLVDTITFKDGSSQTTAGGGGGGGSSSLNVSLGGVQVSSPTSKINFSSSVFTASASPSTTANIGLNSSSVTLQGKLIAGTNITISPGVGVTTITAAGVTTPGNNKNVIYNNSGSLGASDSFSFDGTNVGIGTNTPVAPLHIKSSSDHMLRLDMPSGTVDDILTDYYNSNTLQGSAGWRLYNSSNGDAAGFVILDNSGAKLADFGSTAFVGNQGTTYNANFGVRGTIAFSTATVTTSGPAPTSASMVFCDVSVSTGITIALPDIGGVFQGNGVGLYYHFTKIDSSTNTITFSAPGVSDSIDSVVSLAKQFDWVDYFGTSSAPTTGIGTWRKIAFSTSSVGQFNALSPGVMHIVANSSNVVTAQVSLSTEVTGTLPLANMVSSVTVAGTLVAGTNITLSPGIGVTTITASGSGGGGGYAVEPATVTFKLNQGFSATAGTFTTLSPGVMHITANSSATVTGLVLSTEASTGLRRTALTNVFNGGGSVLVTSTLSISVPFDCTISSWTILGTTGTVSIHVSTSSLTDFRAGRLYNISAAGNSPSVTTDVYNAAAISGWGQSTLTAGDILSFVLDTAVGTTLDTIELWVLKNN